MSPSTKCTHGCRTLRGTSPQARRASALLTVIAALTNACDPTKDVAAQPTEPAEVPSSVVATADASATAEPSADAPPAPLRVRLRDGALLCVENDDAAWIWEADRTEGNYSTTGYCGGFRALQNLWQEVQRCVSLRDSECLSHHVRFPLHINRGQGRVDRIQSPAALHARFDAIFTPVMSSVIAESDASRDAAWCNYIGARLGPGILWASPTETSPKLIAVNYREQKPPADQARTPPSDGLPDSCGGMPEQLRRWARRASPAGI